MSRAAIPVSKAISLTSRQQNIHRSRATLSHSKAQATQNFAGRRIRTTHATSRIMSTASSTFITTRYKLIFFTPPSALPSIKPAIFAAGAGRQGAYSECMFTTPGVGQFKPDETANPHIGERGKLEEVGEVKCETLITGGREVVKKVVEELKRTHPYEEVAYEVYAVEEF